MWLVDRFISDGLGRAAVPFFFMVSGFFLAKHVGEPCWWSAAICKRAKTLLVPHFFWNLLWILLPIAREAFKSLAHGSSSMPSIRLPSFTILWGVLQPPPLGLTWFITTLFGFVVFSPLFVGLVRRHAIATILAVSLLHVAIYNPSPALWGHWRWLVQSIFNLEGLVFFLLGLDFALNKRKAPSRIPGTVLIAIAFMATGLRIYAETIGCAPLYLHARLFVIPGFLLLLWRIVPSVPWPKWLISTAFPLYVIHMFMVDTFHRALCPHLPRELQFGVIALLAILSSIGISVAMRWISPRFASWVFGGR